MLLKFDQVYAGCLTYSTQLEDVAILSSCIEHNNFIFEQAVFFEILIDFSISWYIDDARSVWWHHVGATVRDAAAAGGHYATRVINTIWLPQTPSKGY